MERRLLLATAVASAAGAAGAFGQDYPSKPIRIIAPFEPGTATDSVARVLGSAIGTRARQAVVIDNKPGAEGQIGAQAAATAPVPGFEIRPWSAAYVPAGTAKPIIDKLNALVREAVASEGFRTFSRTTYGVPFPGSPDELAAFQASETIQWGEIVRIAGMQEP